MSSDGPLIFHLSDIHFGCEHRDALSWVEMCVANERPAAVLITGDLTMRARHREYLAAQQWMASLGVPLLVDVGNHDMPYGNLIERFVDPYRRYRMLKAVVESPISLPGVAFIPLKTVTCAQWRFPWSDGHVTDQALAETCAAIDALAPETRVIVTAHHPLFERSPSGKHLTINGERAINALAQRHVEAILTGHVHDAFDRVHQTDSGPLRMVGAGTLSRRTRRDPPGFNAIHIGPTGLMVTQRHFDGALAFS